MSNQTQPLEEKPEPMLWITRHWIYVGGKLVYDSLHTRDTRNPFTIVANYFNIGSNDDIKHVIKRRHVPLYGDPRKADWEDTSAVLSQGDV